MAPTRFTCTLTRADEPYASPAHGSQSWTLTGPQIADVFVTLSPRSTVSPTLTSAGPTPRASTSGSARPLSCAGNGATSLRHGYCVQRPRAPDYEPLRIFGL